MTLSKDPLTARPVSGSFSKSAYASSRPHSHSISLSAANPSHRVSRRKSMNVSASATTAAIAAALREQGEGFAIPVNSHRRSIGTRRSEAHSMSARPSMHTYFGPAAMSETKEEDAVEDNSGEDDTARKNKSRNRRASEGSFLIKGDSKKSGDLRCDTCGKGYKHSSCLTKHMWEHDPAWAITSKLLISKHQQVQLLEAASVLCNMTAETAEAAAAQPELDVAQPEPSETSSASPGYSGYSEMQDEPSSVETTPPPMSEAAYSIPDTKRHSNSSTGFGRSYRSVASSSFAESVLSPGLIPHRLSGVSDFRPATSGTDDGVLAAATAGLNFSGTPRMRPVAMATDIPPVPPLPSQYQSYNSKISDSTLTHIYSPFGLHSQSFNQQLSDERSHREASDERRLEEARDINMDEDEGMFKMEE
ncbi:hypothetical protein DV738_g3187, partial [Chaetothyriales sp. CBS 135597]